MSCGPFFQDSGHSRWWPGITADSSLLLPSPQPVEAIAPRAQPLAAKGRVRGQGHRRGGTRALRSPPTELGPQPRGFPEWGPGPSPSNVQPRPAAAPSMAWRGWPEPGLWVAGCALLLLALVLLVSPRSCRARRGLRGLLMTRSQRLLFRIGLVPAPEAAGASGEGTQWETRAGEGVWAGGSGQNLSSGVWDQRRVLSRWDG